LKSSFGTTNIGAGFKVYFYIKIVLDTMQKSSK